MKATKRTHKSENFLGFVLLLISLIIGFIYVYFTLTPSHYAAVLNQHFDLDYQPLLGTAKDIRGDEYAVVTPYFQIAVNNDFQRYNQTSPYGEDLRFFYGLPLKDWGLIFKPYMWGFWVMDAARALSFYHYFMIAFFLIGVTLFLNRLKLPLGYAAIIAGILFFSHHNQVWWSSNAPVLALTVWIILPFLFNWSYLIKFLTTCYISMMALFALIYPAWQISLVYVFICLTLMFQRGKFRLVNILACGLAFVTATALTYLYYQDSIPLIQNTVYPGNSSYKGGNSVEYFLFAQFAPHSLINNFFEPVIKTRIMNMNTVGTAASLLLAVIVSFSNYNFGFKHIRTHLWKYGISLTFLIIVFSWMFLPIPSSIGKFLLLDRISPHRLTLASGTFIVFLSAFAVFKSRWLFSWYRIVIYLALVLFIPIRINAIQNNSIVILQSFDFYDILVLLPLLIIIIAKTFPKYLKIESKAIAYSFALIALLYNIVSFGGFNPLQEAKDIFSKELTSKVNVLKTEYSFSTENLISYDGPSAIGTALNGLGLPTLNHAFLTPEIEFFKNKFPELSEQELNFTFNRFAKVATHDIFDFPVLVSKDAIGLPSKSVATSIKVRQESDFRDNLSRQQSFAHKVEWLEIKGEKRSLVIDFYSPVILEVRNTSVMPEFNGLQVDYFASTNNNLMAFLSIQPSLKDIFKADGIDLKTTTIWRLYLDFYSADVTLLEALPENLEDIRLEDLHNSIVLRTTKRLDVEKVNNQTFLNKQMFQQPQGNIDVVSYDSDEGLLIVTGWTPVEDIPSVRWIGYKASEQLRLVNSLTKIRADVPTNQGLDLVKGFELKFEFSNYLPNEPIPLCLFSETKALGVFPINSIASHNMNCSRDPILERFDGSVTDLRPQGMIDVVWLDKSTTPHKIIIKGWAPRDQMVESDAIQRWFGFKSDIEIVVLSIKSVPRPDVAKIFGESFAISGFEIELTLESRNLQPIELCLYSRNNELGSFSIFLGNDQSLLECRD